ncbi:MAG: hypothetical protein HYY05_01485 [Chloroflexi bacterium]|nr:hypothetical protein [Chloroflexota bacterium]
MESQYEDPVTQRRRPGCLLRSLVDLFLVMGILSAGFYLGEAIGGPDGAQAGLIAAGVAAFVLPWRRWLWGMRRPWE